MEGSSSLSGAAPYLANLCMSPSIGTLMYPVRPLQLQSPFGAPTALSPPGLQTPDAALAASTDPFRPQSQARWQYQCV